MARNRKIKRYKSIYRSNLPRQLLMIAAGAAVLVAAFLAGWFIYNGVADYLAGRPEGETSSSQAQAPGLSQAGAFDLEETAAPEELRGVYLPASVLMDSAARQAFLAGLDPDAVNAVYFDLKTADGTVTYQSQLELAASAQSVSAQAVDLEAVCGEIRAAGLEPVGRIYAFRDPAAARNLPDAAIKYQGGQVNWLDNTLEAGGQPWLNPYSDTAREYLTRLVEEAAAQGVREIVLEGVQFPGSGYQNLMEFGETGGVSQIDILASFVRQAENAASEAGARLSLYLPVSALVGDSSLVYGASPVAMIGDSLMLGVMPSQYTYALTVGETYLEAPASTPEQTVAASLAAALPQVPEGTRLLVLVQEYDAAGRAYTAADVSAQIAAAEEAGIRQYIRYNTQGSYFDLGA